MVAGLLVRGAGLAVKGIGKALKRQKKTLKNVVKDVKKNPGTTAQEAGLVTGSVLIGGAAIPKKKRKEMQKTLSQSFVRASEKADKRGKNPAGSSIKEMNKK